MSSESSTPAPAPKPAGAHVESRRSRLRRLVQAPGTLAALLAVLTVVTLLGGEAGIGYVRDEGVYLEASRRYGAWMSKWMHERGAANQPEVRDRYFGINHEHPALMKIAGGVSARLLAEPPDPAYVAEVEAKLAKQRNATRRDFDRDIAALDGGTLPLLREGAAMRLPAILLAGLAAAMLFLTGRRLGGGTLGGLLAAGWLLLPRVQFHASLHAFDLPIAVMTLALALAWLRSLDNWRWGLAMGPLLGVAIAIKHNALFLGPLFALHLWLCLGLRWRQTGKRPLLRQLLPLPLWSMAVLGPLVAIMLWPWLWTDTFARIGEYFAFHQEHSYYNMEFWGQNYNRPPLPISYPFVMTWATVPSVLLLLAGLGMLLALRTVRNPAALGVLGRMATDPKLAIPPRWRAPLPSFDGREEPLLILGLAGFPLVLIALPSIPIFGGTKHWLTAYPFMALLAAMAWGRLWMRAEDLLRAWPRLLRWGPAVVLTAVLIPGTWATVHGHPFNLSQYAPLIGGARGAADRGLNRGFWGHAVVPLFAQAEALPPGPAYLHDVHQLAVEQYRREGRWPGWVASGAQRAEIGLLFPEMHMLSDEIALWERMGVAPVMVLTLDDVPVTVVYRRARP